MLSLARVKALLSPSAFLLWSPVFWLSRTFSRVDVAARLDCFADPKARRRINRSGGGTIATYQRRSISAYNIGPASRSGRRLCRHSTESCRKGSATATGACISCRLSRSFSKRRCRCPPPRMRRPCDHDAVSSREQVGSSALR